MQPIEAINIAQQLDAVAMPAVKVNGVELDSEAIAAEMQYHPADTLEQAWQQAAQALVVRQLLVDEAHKLGLAISPLEGESDEEAAIRSLLAEQVQRPEASEEDCQQYFASNPERFKTPVILAASHILLAAHPDDAQARISAQAEAEALIAQLQQQPDSFARLAKQHSACPSKEMDGSLGQLSKGQTVPEFERPLFSLSLGLAERPIESRYGFHVVRIDYREEGQPLPYEQVQDKIRQYLNERVFRTAIGQYIRVLAGQAEIEGIDFEAADSMLIQ